VTTPATIGARTATRRRLLGAFASGPMAWLLPAGAARATADPPLRLVLAWADAEACHWVGAFEAASGLPGLSRVWQTPLPGRAHGLHAMPDGGLLVVAVRPGRWLARLDGDGHVQALRHLPEDAPSTLAGHAVDVPTAAGSKVLVCAATDRHSARGCVELRDLESLEPLGRLSSGGIEPHQILADPSAPGTVWIAHGGIRRDARDRKLDLDAMEPRLTRLDLADGRAAHWSLPDPRLSVRHLARLDAATGAWIGVALQAEHDRPADREAAPVLAVLPPDGGRLQAVAGTTQLAGYAGDIAAAGGGFVVSCPRADRALHWHPERGAVVAASLREAGALAAAAADGNGAALLCAQRGLGRWHPEEPARLWAWPGPMAIDNHAALIPA
jgi:hypothetical protein